MKQKINSTQILDTRLTMVIGVPHSLFPSLTAEFPSTRYQGSKSKLADWIWEQIADLVEHYGQYKYVFSTNSESTEILLIGT